MNINGAMTQMEIQLENNKGLNKMEYKEMEDSLKYGEEYNFYYKDREFWISKNTEGNYLTEVGSGQTQEFKNVEELLDNARIDGKSILTIWKDIEDQF